MARLKRRTQISVNTSNLCHIKKLKRKKNNKTFKRTKTCSLLNIFFKKYIHFFKKMTSNYCPFYNFTNSYICHWSSNYKIRLYSINICWMTKCLWTHSLTLSPAASSFRADSRTPRAEAVAGIDVGECSIPSWWCSDFCFWWKSV